jgi:hypothetical protein
MSRSSPFFLIFSLLLSDRVSVAGRAGIALPSFSVRGTAIGNTGTTSDSRHKQTVAGALLFDGWVNECCDAVLPLAVPVQLLQVAGSALPVAGPVPLAVGTLEFRQAVKIAVLGYHWHGHGDSEPEQCQCTTSALCRHTRHLRPSCQWQRCHDCALLIQSLHLFKRVRDPCLNKPWNWFDVCDLEDKHGLTLPVELQLFVLILGWVHPLPIRLNPLNVAWMSHLWRGYASPDSPSTAVSLHSRQNCEQATPGDVCEHCGQLLTFNDGALQVRAGGYMVLWEHFDEVPGYSTVVGLSEYNHGVVYRQPYTASISSSDNDSDSGSDSDCDSGSDSGSAGKGTELKEEEEEDIVLFPHDQTLLELVLTLIPFHRLRRLPPEDAPSLPTDNLDSVESSADSIG